MLMILFFLVKGLNLTETKKFMLNSHFVMMDLGNAFVVLGIQFFVTGHVAFLDGLKEDILILKV